MAILDYMRGSQNSGKIGELEAYNDMLRMNSNAMQAPGYPQLSDQYSRINQADFPDYMEKFSGYADPGKFLGGLPGMGGGGSSGPLGADQLAEFGEGAYELFDKFTPGMEYIAENQGVGEQELASMLGESSSGYQANIDNQNQQAMRNMRRMGIDPSSGAYAADAGNRAMTGAAGLSGAQNQVRNNARQQDWSERMQAAGIGLDAGKMGTDALGKATSSYNDALGLYTGVYGDYMNTMGNMANTTENARQYNYNQAGSLAGAMTGAVPQYNAMQSSGYNNSLWQPLSGGGGGGGGGGYQAPQTAGPLRGLSQG